MVHAHGCDYPIVYGREDFAQRVLDMTGGEGVPVVYDSVGKATFEASLRCLRRRGIMASFGYVGGAFGIVLSGPVVEGLSWRWLFWLPMILCFASAAAAHRYVPESPVRAEGRISWLSAAT